MNKNAVILHQNTVLPYNLRSQQNNSKYIINALNQHSLINCLITTQSPKNQFNQQNYLLVVNNTTILIFISQIFLEFIQQNFPTQKQIIRYTNMFKNISTLELGVQNIFYYKKTTRRFLEFKPPNQKKKSNNQKIIKI
eukprot:TRINITY_DN23184_c0_g3_i2.p3 TRINITY_DN23184_c0_g3~~TRINITY_DN23184_c0_g3_i2.p3  ORF type:complete len:138 (+),score=2.37 TRINITY_DN23184_c0_g3_i2:205-618(+)